MKIPIYLIGEDSFVLAALRQQLEREVAFYIEPKVYGYGDALDSLRSKGVPLIAVIDLNHDSEKAFSVAEEIKFRLSNVHLVMTSPDRKSTRLNSSHIPL